MNLKDTIQKETYVNNTFSIRKMRASSNAYLAEQCKQVTTFLPEDSTMAQRVWHIVNDLYRFPLCSGGQPRISFRSFPEGYKKTCHLPRFQCSCWDVAKESSSITMKKTNDSGKIKKVFQEKYGTDSPFGVKEFQDKSKQTMIDRYGVINPLQNKELKKKFNETCLERFGAITPLGASVIRDKIVQTNLERYGFENPMQCAEVQTKARETCIERYGFENPMQCAEVQTKVKNTLVERYGVDNPMKFPEIQTKAKETNLERYGFENPMQSEIIKEKMKKTNLEKYGVKHKNQVHLIKIIDQIESQEWWNSWACFSDIYDYLIDFLNKRTIYKKAHQYRPDLDFASISKPHQKINSLLDSLGIEYETNTKQIIAPLELDIHIPSHNLAIEVNGLYWHSELQGKDKNYHLNKFLQCQSKGIRLLQFWDSEINNQWPIISSMITNRLGLTANRIGARECQVRPVDQNEEQVFLQQNHLQGYVSSSLALGLYYENSLVSIMTFRKPRYNQNYDYELLRFATKSGYIIPGAASRLFKQKPSGSIITYADQRYSDGKLYKSLGFEYVSSSKPNYFYTNDYETLQSRIKYQKHKLQNLLESYNPDETEWCNMVANGFDRVWDCGNSAFSFRN